MRINVTRSSMPSFEEYAEEIRELWDTRWLTNMGSKHEQLQHELEAFLGVPHVTLYTNGHLALENAIAAMDLPEGGRSSRRRLPLSPRRMPSAGTVSFRSFAISMSGITRSTRTGSKH